MTKKDPLNYFVAFVIGLPALVSLAFFARYSLNTPWFDDVEALAHFALDYRQSSSLPEKIELLLKPNNEHRIVFGRLCLLISQGLWGSHNYIVLELIGNLCTVGSFGVLLWIFRQLKIAWIYALPMGLLLFQPHYYLLSFWAITSLQHQPAVFLILLSLYGLSLQSRLSFVLALAGLWLATFSVAGGMFGWVAGLVLLLLQQRRSFFKVTLWIFNMLSATGLYLYNLSPQGNESSLGYLLHSPHKILLAFFAFLGGSLDLLPAITAPYRYVLPIFWGFFLVAYTTSWVWKKLCSQQHTIFSLVVLSMWIYILITGVIVAILRPRFGFDTVVVSNYKLYPSIFLVLAYLMYLESDSKELRHFPVLAVLAVLFNIVCYQRFSPDVAQRHKLLLAANFNQQYNGFGLGGEPSTALGNFIDKTMNQLSEKKLYQYPTTVFTAFDFTQQQAIRNFGYPVLLDTSNQSFRLIVPHYKLGLNVADGLYFVVAPVMHAPIIFGGQTSETITRRPPFLKNIATTCQIPLRLLRESPVKILEIKNGQKILYALPVPYNVVSISN